MVRAADLAVVIPTHGRPDVLEQTLEGLDLQTVSGHQIVVVIDGKGEAPSNFDGLVIEQEHAGPAAARNRGVAATNRELVLFLGSDMVPTPTFVEEHLRWHDERPEDTAAVLGHVDWHPSVASSAIHRWLDWSSTQFDYVRLAGMEGSDVGPGRFYSCNVSLKRALFDKVEGFDSDFIFYYEDLDMGIRLAEAGMELLYAPDALVHHVHQYDHAALRRRFEGIALGERMMAAKHPTFEPFFYRRVTRHLVRPPVSRWWPRLVDLIPPGALRDRARRKADRWYHQQMGPTFLERWDRAAAVVELWEYLGEDFDPRMLTGHEQAVSREALDARDEEDFYRTSTGYLYDLTVFEMSGTKDPYLDVVRRLAPPDSTVLDYGCGIGADGLRLLEEGWDVHFADFGNPSTAYLRWRLERRGRDAPIMDIERDELAPVYDLAWSFDVIEHVAEPFEFIERLETVARIVVLNLLEEDDEDHDHHMHHHLPIEEIIEHARGRGLLELSLHHGRSHLVAWRSPLGGA